MAYTIQQHLAYSTWANEKLVEKLWELNDKVLFVEVKSSFSSIAKTLLHMWDAETIWIKRLQGESLTTWPSQNFSGTKDDLLKGVVNSSRQLLSFVELRDEAFIQSKISYKNLKGESFENEVEPLLYHLVNHGTYHRGQVTTMLRELGVTHLASTDIIFYLRTLKD